MYIISLYIYIYISDIRSTSKALASYEKLRDSKTAELDAAQSALEEQAGENGAKALSIIK